MSLNIGSEILWLSENDVAELLSMKEALIAMESVFLLHGKKEVQMPVKVYLNFDPFGGDLRAMPAYIKGKNPAAGVKIVNSNAGNPEKGLPAVSGVMAYHDPKTGLPLGVFAAGNLTGIRTGAAGGLAAKLLARKESSTVGLVGCGRQAHTQLEALHEIFSLYKIFLLGKTGSEVESFISSVKAQFPFDLVPCQNVKEACDADIVVTTTPVRKPVVESAWIKSGTHVNAVGADAPGKQELEPALLYKSRVVVDSWDQASHAGEINVEVSMGRFTKSQLAAELGEIVTGVKKGRVSEPDITIFDSTGLAIQDVAVAQVLYAKALQF